MINDKKISDILKYNKTFNIEKKSYVEYIEEDKKDDDNSLSKKELSTSLKEFILNKPSTCISMIDNTINIYKDEIEKFKELNDNKLLDYINNKNNLDENFSNVEGSTPLEGYVQLEEIFNFLNELKNNYTFMIYGKDVDLYEELDNEYINHLISLEENDKYQNINYFMLYFDTAISILNKSTVNFLTEILIDLSLLKNKENNENIDVDTREMIIKTFDINNKKLKIDILKEKDNFKNYINLIKTIYIEKDKMSRFMPILSKSYMYNEPEIFLDSKKEMLKEIDILLEDLIKTEETIKICKKDTCKKLLKKNKFRAFF